MKSYKADPAVIYVTQCGDFSLYKIGWSAKYSARLQGAQVDNPFALTPQFIVLTTKKAAPKAEWWAKERLVSYLHRGEWYTDLDRMKEEILRAVTEIEAKLYPGIDWFGDERIAYDRQKLRGIEPVARYGG